MSTPGGPTTRPIPTVPSSDAAKASSQAADAQAGKAADQAAEKAAGGPSVPPMPQRPAPRTTGTGAARPSGAAGSAAAARAAAAGATSSTGAGVAPGARPASRPAGARLVSGGPTAAGAPPRAGRKVQLAVTRIEPWSAFKMSLLLSTAAAVGFIVGTVLLWSVLKGMGVYDDIDGVIKNLQSNTSDPFSIMDYIGLGRVTSLAMVIGVVDVVLLTALGTLGAYLYNVCASLVGGVQLTLTDD